MDKLKSSNISLHSNNCSLAKMSFEDLKNIKPENKSSKYIENISESEPEFEYKNVFFFKSNLFANKLTILISF